MIITFIGHSKLTVTDELRGAVSAAIEQSAADGGATFYCGGYGDFDYLCAQIVRELSQKKQGISSYFVTPYLSDSYKERLQIMQNSGLYDGIIYPELENVPPRFAISKRNQYMVDEAQLIIAYVRYDWGGAYKTLRYAQRKGKRIINLAQSFE